MDTALASEILLPAILLGLGTSIHCVGMCGPIALSLGLEKGLNFKLLSKNLTYQLGRTTTYAFMGLFLGFVGQVSFGNGQRYLSIALGILMVGMAFFPMKLNGSEVKLIRKPFLWLKLRLGKLLGRKSYNSLFVIGLLNGLLPCGAVYIALAASLVMADALESALFMAIFGLGTIPLMFLMVLAGNTLNITLRKRLFKAFPYIIAILGVSFILRGMSLDIPYISPSEEALNIESPECCH